MTDIFPNYTNLQTLNVEDLQQEHDYLLDRIQETTVALGLNGVTGLNGLEITQDSIVIEQFPYPSVTNDATNPLLLNYIDLPFDTTSTATSSIYSVFQATSNNIQRLDLRLQILPITNASFVTISLVVLNNPLDPLSGLSNQVLTRRIVNIADLPTATDSSPLIIDYSGDNNRQGQTTIAGNYYGVLIDFILTTGSQDQLRVFYSNTTQTQAINSNLYSWVFFGTNYQQGLYNGSAVYQQFAMYMKVYTSAVMVSPGTAYDPTGQPIRIATAQRWLGLIARGAGNPLNYIVASYTTVIDATASAARTGNSSVSRFEDSFQLQVLGQGQYDELVTLNASPFVLLGVVSDHNVLNFSSVQTFTLAANSNLSYHDWLVPSNSQPSIAAQAVVNQRPLDFVFVADNVPSSVILSDFAGVPVLDNNGQQQSDPVVFVYLDLYFNGGQNVRPLQMSAVKETTSVPSYRTYAATLTPPSNTNLVPYSYPFDIAEFAADTYYNFRLVTGSGNTIYIQDFDRVVDAVDPNTGLNIPIRSEQFPVAAEANTIVLQVNTDLQLGASSLSSGAAGQELLGYKVVYHDNETATAVGVAVNERIVPYTDTILPDMPLLGNEVTAYGPFAPLPVCDRDGNPVLNNDVSLQAAIASGDFALLINGVNATFSGTSSATKGGRGAPMTIFGQLISNGSFVAADYIGAVVVARNADGKDNTQQTTTYTVEQDPVTGNIEFTVIALGQGNDSDAGFAAGENVYIYLNDQPALDANNVPLIVTFNAYQAVPVKVYNAASQVYFTGKVIVSAGDHMVNGLPAPDIGQIAIDPIAGRVYFPTDVSQEKGVPYGTVSVQFLQLNTTIPVVDYYQTNTAPFGTALKQPISNNDNAVATAVARGEILILVDGRDIRAGNALQTGAVKIVANTQQNPLVTNTISIDPILGKIVFDQSFTVGSPPFLTPTSVVSVSYYHIIPITISTVSQTFGVYDPKYDLNSDGCINQQDLAIFQAAFGSVVGQPNYNLAADFNNDGAVNAADQTEFQQVFGTCSSGLPSVYTDATQARLNSILVYNQADPSSRFTVIRAVSIAATASQNGSTLLFLSADTPIATRGIYVVAFGFPNLLAGTINTFTVQTETPFAQPIDYGSISGYNQTTPSQTVSVFDSTTTTALNGAVTVYNTQFTFNPPIRSSGIWVFESDWVGTNLNVFSRRKPVSPLEYESSQRKNIGPFDLVLSSGSFAPDGTSIALAIGPRDSTYADGTTANNGLFVSGVPISSVLFRVILRVATTDGSNEYDEWIWERLAPDINTGLITLNYNNALVIANRNQGRNGGIVLQPFGLAPSQIALKPGYAGGDVSNDLSNILVFRDQTTADVQPHDHSDPNSGGQLLADTIIVPNNNGGTSTTNLNQGCTFAGDNPTLTNVLCQLLEKIQQVQQIGDFGNEIVPITGCTPQYGGTSPPIRISTAVNGICFAPCGPIVAVNPPWEGGLGGWGASPSDIAFYYAHPECCTVRIKVGTVGNGYFDVEYCVSPDYAHGVVLDFNWAACGPVSPCPVAPVIPPLIGQINALQSCTFHFSGFVACSDGAPTYAWDLGDGSPTQSQRDFDYTYAAAGTYKVTLVATCANGQTFTDTLIVVAC